MSHAEACKAARDAGRARGFQFARERPLVVIDPPHGLADALGRSTQPELMLANTVGIDATELFGDARTRYVTQDLPSMDCDGIPTNGAIDVGKWTMGQWFVWQAWQSYVLGVLMGLNAWNLERVQAVNGELERRTTERFPDVDMDQVVTWDLLDQEEKDGMFVRLNDGRQLGLPEYIEVPLASAAWDRSEN